MNDGSNTEACRYITDRWHAKSWADARRDILASLDVLTGATLHVAGTWFWVDAPNATDEYVRGMIRASKWATRDGAPCAEGSQ